MFDKLELDRLVHYDALDEAEKITGKSYKVDDSTMLLGFGLMLKSAEAKKTVLKDAGDTYWGITVAEFITMLGNRGFEQVYHEDFVYDGGQCDQSHPEQFFIFWNETLGQLIVFDTWSAGSDVQHINSGNCYYNIAKTSDDLWKYTSSGGYALPNIHVGHCDIREGLFNSLALMAEHGIFLPQWVEQPNLWLIHCGDKEKAPSDFMIAFKDKFYDKLTEGRILKLPMKVQKAILALV